MNKNETNPWPGRPGTAPSATAEKQEPLEISQAELIHDTADFFETLNSRIGRPKIIRPRYLSIE